MKVQACPPRDRRPDIRSKVSGQEGKEDEWDHLEILEINHKIMYDTAMSTLSLSNNNN